MDLDLGFENWDFRFGYSTIIQFYNSTIANISTSRKRWTVNRRPWTINQDYNDYLYVSHLLFSPVKCAWSENVSSRQPREEVLILVTEQFAIFNCSSNVFCNGNSRICCITTEILPPEVKTNTVSSLADASFTLFNPDRMRAEKSTQLSL